MPQCTGLFWSTIWLAACCCLNQLGLIFNWVVSNKHLNPNIKMYLICRLQNVFHFARTQRVEWERFHSTEIIYTRKLTQSYFHLVGRLRRMSVIKKHLLCIAMQIQHGSVSVSRDLTHCDLVTLWHHRSGLILTQIWAWCLTAPSLYLNIYWLICIIIKVHWY